MKIRCGEYIFNLDEFHRESGLGYPRMRCPFCGASGDDLELYISEEDYRGRMMRRGLCTAEKCGRFIAVILNTDEVCPEAIYICTPAEG